MSNRTKHILLMVLTLALVGIFLMFGADKFMDPVKWTGKFTAWGLPPWLVPLSGAIELAGAVALLVPVLRGPAGLGLGLFMVGAVATHVIHAEIGMTFVASFILAGSFIVGWLRLPETLATMRQSIHSAG